MLIEKTILNQATNTRAYTLFILKKIISYEDEEGGKPPLVHYGEG